MALQVTTSKISEVGIKRETTHGTIGSGSYRGLLVTNFTSAESGDFAVQQRIAGTKGMSFQGNSGSNQDVSFTIIAGSGDSAMATMIDIIDMIMGNDAVTGSDPFTHTFTLAASPTPMPSWTLFHDDNNSNFRVFRGFVPDTLTINIDKSAATITMDVSGFAWDEGDTTDKSPSFTGGISIYNPRKAALFIGALALENFNTATIEISQAAAVHNTINNTGVPSQIDGETLNCIVTLDGLWNEGTGQLSDSIRTAFLDKAITSALVVQFGLSQTNDGFRLTLPKWAITSHTAKDLAVGEFLPQVLTAEAIHQDDVATNGFKIEIFNTEAGDWDTL